MRALFVTFRLQIRGFRLQGSGWWNCEPPPGVLSPCALVESCWRAQTSANRLPPGACAHTCIRGNTLKQHVLQRSALFVGAIGIAAIALTGCSSSASEPTTDATPEVSSPAGSSQTTGTGQAALAPVPFNKPVTYGNGVSVAVVKAERTKVSGQGPGEVAGDGIRFNLKVTNASGSEINLDNVAVNAFYGKAKTPASPSPTSDQPFSGKLQQGASVDGSYVFMLPAGAGPVELQFSYATAQPVAVFVGKV